MLQFHMSGLLLWPGVAAVLALSGRKLNLRWLLAGVAAGLLLFVPYLKGDSADGWQNTLGMFSGKGGRTWDSLKALSVPFNFLVNLVPSWTRSWAEYREVGRACFGAFGLFLALNVLSLAVAAALSWGAFQQIRTAARGQWRKPREMFRQHPGLVFLATVLLMPLVCALLSGNPFHARYALVLLPALVALAGCGAVQALRWPRLGKWVLAALLVTTGVNIWFMPAYFHHQAGRIAQGDLFIPGFRKLEAVYQAVKNHAAHRPIQIHDAAYLSTLKPQDKSHRDANLIGRYIAVREKETHSTPGAQGHAVAYRLCRADDAVADDPAVAFRANGIALVEVPASSEAGPPRANASPHD